MDNRYTVWCGGRVERGEVGDIASICIEGSFEDVVGSVKHLRNLVSAEFVVLFDTVDDGAGGYHVPNIIEGVAGDEIATFNATNVSVVLEGFWEGM